MASEQLSNNQESAKMIKRNRFFGVVIILIVMAPMLLAYIMYHTGWGVSGQTTNKGSLLNPPVSIQDLSLTSNAQTFNVLFNDKDASKKWRLLVPVTAACQDVCQKNLYTTRQVHIRLAQKAYRVERILLAIDELPLSFENQLQQEHPNSLRVTTTNALFSQWIKMANIHKNAEQFYYLVDQQGYVMMKYDVSHTGQDLLDDIKKLLKFTYDN